MTREIGTNRELIPRSRSLAQPSTKISRSYLYRQRHGDEFCNIAMRVEDGQFNKRLATGNRKNSTRFCVSTQFYDPEISVMHMKRIVQTSQQASALIITMLTVFLIAVAIGIAMNVTTATLRQTGSSRDFSALRSATEGAAEFGYGVWVKTINSYYAPVSNSRLTTALGTAPSFPGFSYVTALQVTGTDQYGDPYGAANSTATPAPTRVNLDNYPGWTGSNTSYLASVKMQGTFLGGRTVRPGSSARLTTRWCRSFRPPLFLRTISNCIGQPR